MPLTPDEIKQMDAVTGLGAPAAQPAGTLTPAEISSMDKVSGLPPSATPSFTDEVGQAYDKRVAMAQDLANRGVAGEKSMPATIAEMAGTGMGGMVKDVGNIVAGKFYNAVTQNGELGHINETARAVAQSPVGQAVGKAADYVGDQYSQLPQGVQDAGNAIGNTLGAAAAVLPVAKAMPGVTGAINKGLGATGDAMVASGTAARDSNRAKFAADLVAPMNASKADKIDAVGNTEVKGILQKSVVQPTAQEVESAGHVAAIEGVSPSNTVQKNYNAISDAIGTEAEDLKDKLSKSPISYENKTYPIYGKPTASNIFTPVLDDAVKGISENATITGDAKNMALGLAQKMKDLVAKNDPTPSGLLQARKEFDQFVQQNKPRVFNPDVDTAISVANKVIRQTTNDFIAKTVPDAGVKASLTKQSSLYNALDNIAPKAAAEAPTVLGRLAQKADAMVPVKNALVKGTGATLGAAGLATGAVAAPLATAGVLGTGAGLYGAAKLAAAPATRIGIGRTLQELARGNPQDVLEYFKQLHGKK